MTTGSRLCGRDHPRRAAGISGSSRASLAHRRYQAVVDWAVSMADQMQFRIHVVPMNATDVMRTVRVKQATARLTGQERGELRRQVVAALAEVMRDCQQTQRPV